MKDGALFINTSRAEIVDEDALLWAVENKKIRAALDVFKDEPEAKSGSVSSKLQSNPNIYVTHHIGASTEQAQNAVAEETVRIIKDYLTSGVIAHWVNRAKITDAKYQLIVKHYDKPGVLASVLNIIREANINIEEIENVIFEGGVVACCTLKLKDPLPQDLLNQIKNNENVLSISHVAI
jgi:D-3-phosphoglycerate dehydrogenase